MGEIIHSAIVTHLMWWFRNQLVGKTPAEKLILAKELLKKVREMVEDLEESI